MAARQAKWAKEDGRARSVSSPTAPSAIATMPSTTGATAPAPTATVTGGTRRAPPPAHVKPETDEHRKAKAMEDSIKRKERNERRRSRSRSEEALESGDLTEEGTSPISITGTGGGGGPSVVRSPSTGGGGNLSPLGENTHYDDEEQLSPKTRATKPKAMPGCVVHSVWGKFVQVPLMGGGPLVPSAGARRKGFKEANSYNPKASKKVEDEDD